jgi:hypothetical protein
MRREALPLTEELGVLRIVTGRLEAAGIPYVRARG